MDKSLSQFWETEISDFYIFGAITFGKWFDFDEIWDSYKKQYLEF